MTPGNWDDELNTAPETYGCPASIQVQAQKIANTQVTTVADGWDPEDLDELNLDRLNRVELIVPSTSNTIAMVLDFKHDNGNCYYKAESPSMKTAAYRANLRANAKPDSRVTDVALREDSRWGEQNHLEGILRSYRRNPANATFTLRSRQFSHYGAGRNAVFEEWGYKFKGNFNANPLNVAV